MAASILATDDEFKTNIDTLGLMSDHTYGILDVYELDNEG